MKNKEEVLIAIDWCIAEYKDCIGKQYAEIVNRYMNTGVCGKLRSHEVYKVNINTVSRLGFRYVSENKKYLKEIFPLCFKRSRTNMKEYWCKMMPSFASSQEQMQQSLAIRLYILNEIKLIVQNL